MRTDTCVQTCVQARVAEMTPCRTSGRVVVLRSMLAGYFVDIHIVMGIHRYSLMFIDIRRCLWMSIDVHRCLQMFIDVY